MELFHDQHRTSRVAQSSFRDAAEKKTAQTGPTVATHDDHRGAQALGLACDDLCEVRTACEHKLAILGLQAFALQKFAEIVPRVTLHQAVEVEPSPGGRIN